ncbi:MAG: hypothetical protein IKU22_01560 [Alistipes sp.]|nr:hypothetical protein [Alistipes sp.]
MNAIIIIASAIYAILCVLIFIKFWGMCNDVRELKNYFIKTTQPQQITPNTNPVVENVYEVGQTVIYPPANRIMIVKEIDAEGLISCFSYDKNGKEEFEGKYKPTQIKHYTK